MLLVTVALFLCVIAIPLLDCDHFEVKIFAIHINGYGKYDNVALQLFFDDVLTSSYIDRRFIMYSSPAHAVNDTLTRSRGYDAVNKLLHEMLSDIQFIVQKMFYHISGPYPGIYTVLCNLI